MSDEQAKNHATAPDRAGVSSALERLCDLATGAAIAATVLFLASAWHEAHREGGPASALAAVVALGEELVAAAEAEQGAGALARCNGEALTPSALGALQTAMADDGRTAQFGLDRIAGFLACAIQTDPAHYCEAGPRQGLLDRVRATLALRRELSGVSLPAPVDDPESGSEQLAAAVAGLVADGIVLPQHVATLLTPVWPDDLDRLAAGVEPGASSCP